MKSLEEALKKYSQTRLRPDESSYTAILLKDALQIADESGVSLFQVEEEAMILGILPERYSRNQKSLTTEEQLLLHRSHVAIIGLGGLGGSVLEMLSRVGVGNLTLVDGDSFDESNLNRQLLSTVENLGRPKVVVAEERAKSLNPAIRISAHLDIFTMKNNRILLQGAGIAVDCLDTIRDRFLLERGCREMNIPMISAAIGGTYGQATMIHPGDPGLQLIYGNPEKAPVRGLEAVTGTLGYAAMHMATIECSEVVDNILQKKSKLHKGLLISDISDHSCELIRF
jgi:molybdopterin/thiamine biosynthesis adenylyltransferase